MPGDCGALPSKFSKTVNKDCSKIKLKARYAYQIRNNSKTIIYINFSLKKQSHLKNKPSQIKV